MTTATYTDAPATLRATVKTGSGGTALPAEVETQIRRVVVDSHLHLPAMFEITFNDSAGTVLATSGISIGSEIKITAGASEKSSLQPLITGEVTSIEGSFEYMTRLTVVRGYDKTHRLQRVRRTRTFLNMKDSDIARQVVQESGLTVGVIQETKTTHDHVGQVDQTDWDFLRMRAREIGYEFGVASDKFYFRKASSVTGASGTPLPLTTLESLHKFWPRVTAGNLASKVEVRVWDPINTKVVASTAAITSNSATLGKTTPASLASSFGGSAAAPAAPSTGSGLGPPPSTSAFVLSDRPLASGSAINSAVDEVVAGLADHLASTFAEAVGEAIGNPAIMAGSAIKVSDVPGPFDGTWLVTSASHVFDEGEGGYRTIFAVSGRQDRSLLGLTAGGDPGRAVRPQLPGVYCGVVTNINDPQTHGRVKVALPWLSPEYETDWGPTVQFGAGATTGAMFLPQVGDEVLVGFEFADPRRPYVIGGLLNSKSTYSAGGAPLKVTGASASVVRRGIVTPSNNMLSFDDDVPPGGGPPMASSILLGTGDSSLALSIDQTAGTVTLTCKPAPPNSQTPMGQLTIECGDAGVINIKTGAGGQINIDGGAALSMKAQESVQIQSSGIVSIKGAEIQLN